MKVLVPLAEGFEEIEAVTIIDLLRRAGIETVTASIGADTVKGSHGITITADMLLDEKTRFDAIVLPGGMPGSKNLKNDPRVISIIKEINSSGGLTAALCAAPIVLSEAGVLKKRKFTCYPGYEKEIPEGIHNKENVVIDGSIITGMGAGPAPLFALTIVEYLKDKETAQRIKEQIIGFW
jgi:4-methyl-5(b-hydroxyethyl)-thiazole monophosphate biosynthesis